MVWAVRRFALSGTDKPCSHFETVCHTTFSFTASSCCESPFDFLIVLMFSFSIVNEHPPSVRQPYCRPSPPVAASNAG